MDLTYPKKRRSHHFSGIQILYDEAPVLPGTRCLHVSSLPSGTMLDISSMAQWIFWGVGFRNIPGIPHGTILPSGWCGWIFNPWSTPIWRGNPWKSKTQTSVWRNEGWTLWKKSGESKIVQPTIFQGLHPAGFLPSESVYTINCSHWMFSLQVGSPLVALLLEKSWQVGKKLVFQAVFFLLLGWTQR